MNSLAGKFALILGLLLMSAAACRAMDFSADYTVRSPEGRTKGRVYFSGDKMRRDVTVPGREQSFITRGDKKLVWTLGPDGKTLAEQAMQGNLASQTGIADEARDKIAREFLGDEKLGSRDVKKYLVTINSQGRRSQTYQWMQPGLAIPVRVQTLDGRHTIEYRNIRQEAQPAALFEPPDDLQKTAASR